MRVRRTALAVAAAAGLTLALVTAPDASAMRAPDRTTARAASASIDKEALPIRGRAKVAAATRTLLITNHGGPVMTAATGTNAYVIWYGNWAAGGKTILTDFLSTVGGSPYFGINTTYTASTGAKVANKVTLAGQTTDTGTATTLSDANILTIVSNAITSGRLPKDTNGVYFVLTAAGVTESSGFLTRYCGWHTHGTVGGSDIKYSFVGDATGSSLSNCAQQTTASPNGNPGVDGMTSVVAHELEETVTDPDLNAWYDSRGNENGDKCAWTFGTTYSAVGGGIANMKLGARDYLIQRNWKAGLSTAQGCFLS
jgi:hypothetical protein